MPQLLLCPRSLCDTLGMLIRYVSHYQKHLHVHIGMHTLSLFTGTQTKTQQQGGQSSLSPSRTDADSHNAVTMQEQRSMGCARSSRSCTYTQAGWEQHGKSWLHIHTTTDACPCPELWQTNGLNHKHARPLHNAFPLPNSGPPEGQNPRTLAQHQSHGTCCSCLPDLQHKWNAGCGLRVSLLSVISCTVNVRSLINHHSRQMRI